MRIRRIEDQIIKQTSFRKWSKSKDTDDDSISVQKEARVNGESNSIGLNADIVNCTIIIAIVPNPAVNDDVRELRTLVKTPIYMNNKIKGIKANNKVFNGNDSKNRPI